MDDLNNVRQFDILGLHLPQDGANIVVVDAFDECATVFAVCAEVDALPVVEQVIDRLFQLRQYLTGYVYSAVVRFLDDWIDTTCHHLAGFIAALASHGQRGFRVGAAVVAALLAAELEAVVEVDGAALVGRHGAYPKAAAIAKCFLGGAGLQPPKVFVGEFVLCHVMLLGHLRPPSPAVRLAVRFGADKGRSPLMRREQRS